MDYQSPALASLGTAMSVVLGTELVGEQDKPEEMGSLSKGGDIPAGLDE